MKLFCISDSVEEQFFGPYSKKHLADKVLKIVQEVLDEDAIMHEVESDPNEKELQANLIPVKVSITIRGGQVTETTVEKTWPPSEEGLIMSTDTYRLFFFWVKNRTDAIVRASKIRVPEAGKEESQEIEA
jgi:hypothetical protein